MYTWVNGAAFTKGNRSRLITEKGEQQTSEMGRPLIEAETSRERGKRKRNTCAERCREEKVVRGQPLKEVTNSAAPFEGKRQEQSSKQPRGR